MIFLLVLVTSAPMAASSRAKSTKHKLAGNETERPCVGCNKYPEAPNYPDDWLTEVGLVQSIQQLQEIEQDEGGALTDEEKEEALKLKFEMAAHAVFNSMQGQVCMDMCAVCMPNMADMTSEKTAQLQSIHISRSKNWQNTSIMPVLGTVDTALGAVVGTLSGIPVGLASFFVGGGVTGAVAGTATGEFVANKTGSSFAGNILGAIAGIGTGAVSGATYLATSEILGLTAGMWKGAGLTAATTDCKRVGFERFHGGENRDEGPEKDQPFTSIPWDSHYGLKRLRQWMKDNEGWEQNTALHEIFPGDDTSIRHCERVREHSFDMRHASECVKHSQICGPSGGFILPVPGKDMCKQVSDINYLEEKAIELGDDPETGMFAQWRKMQQEISEKTGFDGKKAQCINTLCKYGGYRKASMKLHPDRLVRMNIPAEEKLLLKNTFVFLNSCKTEYTGADGEELTLNSSEERDSVCKAQP